MRTLQRVVIGVLWIVIGVALAALTVPPAWLAFAGLFGYVLAIMAWIVSIALSDKRQPVKPSVVVHEDGSIEVQP